VKPIGAVVDDLENKAEKKTVKKKPAEKKADVKKKVEVKK